MRWWRRPWAGRRPEPGSTVAELARTAVSASAADATLDLTRITDAYAAWAHDRGTAGELAEAQFMRALSVAREAQRRVLSEDRQRLLARTEAVAAEAAYHSGLEGRGREAVVVLEQARAIVVARLLGAVHPRTAAALRAAGRERLLAEYLAAVRRRADAYRRSGGGASHGDRAGGQSALGSAQAAVVRLTRQMATQAGYTPAAGATFAAVQLAAARTPLLYVAAAEAGGYALLVRAAGDPWFVPLPELSLDGTVHHVAEVLRRPTQPESVRRCVDDLTAALGQPLAEVLAADVEVAVVPVGGLSLLPVHAALMQATGARTDGPVAVRYLPNAAAVVDSPGPWLAGACTRVLAVDSRGRDARPEPTVLADRFGDRARLLVDAGRAEVLRYLPDADLVQFFCAASADLTDPLAGGLALREGLLTVESLLAHRPARRQLLVLGPCENQWRGEAPPDEVVGLPAALVHAGAAGVVATLWPADERATAALLRRFHELLTRGLAPVRCLALAQRWLRTATHDALATAHPDLFSAPPARTAALQSQRSTSMPYADPVHWAAFCFTGE